MAFDDGFLMIGQYAKIEDDDEHDEEDDEFRVRICNINKARECQVLV